jgi:hypothetical protein
MFVELSAVEGHEIDAILREADDLTRLWVAVQPGIRPEDLTRHVALEWSGTIDSEHAWISIERLRTLGYSSDSAWVERFDAVIAYAASREWVSSDGRLVRAHLQ